MSFDQLAATWDEDPKKVKRANAFAQAISNFLPKNKELSGIEFGCGTGLLSFELKDAFKSITLIDTSEGMIKVLKEKIKQNKLDYFHPLCADVLSEKADIQKQDVMYMSMAFHHVHDTQKALGVFNNLINTGGYLCIGDLVKEDGSFHRHVTDFDGYNGFDRKNLSEELKKSGFNEVFYKEVFTIEKEVDGKVRNYPLFLMIAEKVDR